MELQSISYNEDFIVRVSVYQHGTFNGNTAINLQSCIAKALRRNNIEFTMTVTNTSASRGDEYTFDIVAFF